MEINKIKKFKITLNKGKQQKFEKILKKFKVKLDKEQIFISKKFFKRYGKPIHIAVKSYFKKKKLNNPSNNLLIYKRLIKLEYIRFITKFLKNKNYKNIFLNKIFIEKKNKLIILKKLKKIFFKRYIILINKSLKKKRKQVKTISPKLIYPEIWVNNNNSNSNIVLYNELISLGAFLGNYSSWSNMSQTSYFIGYKNFYSFYTLEISMIWLTRAIKFLKEVLNTNTKTKFIFIGNPDDYDEVYQQIFYEIKEKFFSNDNWEPGFFSKKYRGISSNYILIIYDITKNKLAYNEAVNRKIPVIAFVTPMCEISSVDYPILLNLKNGPLWFGRFCKALLILTKIKKNDTKFRYTKV